ncbi:MAG: GNAT family N-acetyltransferase [Paracoccaceae bacterium]|nr:GNAT family N-acetyltransferase [Paracoccaceae bacterium]
MNVEMSFAQPVIAALWFDLRPLRLSDLGLLELHLADLRVARTTGRIAHPLPPGVTKAYIERALQPSRDEDIWAIDGTKSGLPDVMGVISLRRLDRDQSELGYWIAASFWNTDLASEAVLALIEANPMDNTSIFASVFQDNLAATRVLSKSGFSYLGEAETFNLARGENMPTWTYTIKLTPGAGSKRLV